MIRTLLTGFWICSGVFSGDGAVSRQDQGIEGTVYLVSGNQMPAPGHKRPPLPGVQTTLYIYELTNIRQVTRQGQSPYFLAIRTKLIKQVGTDSLGHFRVGLPAGRYSLFTRKNGLYYASGYDTENNIAPVEVFPGRITKADCKTEGDRRPVY